LDTAYFKELEKLSLNSQGRGGFKIAYSPIHGTGIYAVPQALKRFGFDNIIIVPEQREPNGNFPTVKSPNPEDPDAMEMVLELAKKENADLVIATDPDTDRIAVITKEEKDFVWFNGNQLGCLLIDYVLGSLKRANALPSDATIIKTIVTTELQDLIAEHYGVDSTNTLTGFKWICDLIERYETGEIKPYRNFICGGEESYGFLMGKFVRDKDAIIASCIAAEMTAWHKSEGRTLSQALDAIFARHGVYHERLHTLTLQGKEGADKIQEIMTAIRKNPPHIVGDHAVICFLDILTGEYKELGADGFKTAAKLGLPSSNVLQFYLKDNIKVSVRPSGTEPKIKFYISAHASSLGKTGHDLAPIKKQVEELTKEVENDFISLAKLLGNA
ncbi:MAG: phospho-sugar mutase, partial [Bdellovibrionota bacterium]